MIILLLRIRSPTYCTYLEGEPCLKLGIRKRRLVLPPYPDELWLFSVVVALLGSEVALALNYTCGWLTALSRSPVGK